MMKSHKPLILIIDDEESLRDGCRQALEKSGYAVLTAGEGAIVYTMVAAQKEAFDHLPRSLSPDLHNKNRIENLVDFK